MSAVSSGPSSALEFVEVSADDPRSIELIVEVQAVYRRLYGSEDDSPMSSAEFEPPSGTFLLAMEAEGHPIGCVGLRRHEDHVAEIKRMYVRLGYRRHGYARAMLVAAENRARLLGYTAIVLETGRCSPRRWPCMWVTATSRFPASGTTDAPRVAAVSAGSCDLAGQRVQPLREIDRVVRRMHLHVVVEVDVDIARSAVRRRFAAAPAVDQPAQRSSAVSE